MITASPQHTDLRLMPVGTATWRVVAPNGRALGHVAAEEVDSGTRYHARRFHVPTTTTMLLGSFWSFEEAVDCVRWS